MWQTAVIVVALAIAPATVAAATPAVAAHPIPQVTEETAAATQAEIQEPITSHKVPPRPADH